MNRVWIARPPYAPGRSYSSLRPRLKPELVRDGSAPSGTRIAVFSSPQVNFLVICPGALSLDTTILASQPVCGKPSQAQWPAELWGNWGNLKWLNWWAVDTQQQKTLTPCRCCHLLTMNRNKWTDEKFHTLAFRHPGLWPCEQIPMLRPARWEHKPHPFKLSRLVSLLIPKPICLETLFFLKRPLFSFQLNWLKKLGLYFPQKEFPKSYSLPIFPFFWESVMLLLLSRSFL